MSESITDSDRAIDNPGIDERGIPDAQRKPVKHDPYDIPPAKIGDVPKPGQLPTEVTESLTSGDRLLIDSKYKESDKPGQYVGYNIYSIYNAKDELVSEYLEPTTDDIIVPETKQKTERGTVSRGTEKDMPLASPKKMSLPKKKRLPKQMISKKSVVDKELEARRRRAKIDIEKAPYVWRIQEITEQMKELKDYLSDPFGKDLEEQISYWTSSPAEGGMIGPDGIAAAGRMVGKIRQAREKLEELELEIEALKEFLALIESESRSNQ